MYLVWLFMLLLFNCQYDLQVVDYIFPVMIKDALLTSHPISTPIKDPDDINQFFDAISYDKVSYR